MIFVEDESESEDELCDPVENATASNLQTTWKNLNPPMKEEQILGKWYAVIYTKRSAQTCSLWQNFYATSLVMKMVQQSPWK